MESSAMILYLLAAIAGLVSLEMRQARATVVAVGAAFGFVAVAMFLAGATEVGVGVIVAGAVLVAVLNWAFRRTVQRDELPALPAGAAGILAIASVAVFAVVLFLAASQLFGGVSPAEVETHSGTQVGLLREALVVIAALAAVWAMLRKSGRRDE